MSLDLAQLRDLVVVPTLSNLGMYSLAAEQLVMGTIAQESRGTYLKQLGKGPALGLIQMEPATHADIWRNFVRYTKRLTVDLRALLSAEADDVFEVCGVPDDTELITNLKYAVAMCRVHYWRKPQTLPEANNIKALGEYWKDHYNTFKGAGTVDEFINHFPYELYGIDKEQYV
ncbi:hypothetical protein GV054_09095 [Marinomonas mediterranea]|jgi:hypothetical protein|uniref:Transglycosylase SLT domain-containing protein n=1 Tax=Marinomonas mediterranea (strain ATCC 700492 / JCM 21426 / NBRC 103028 / MMB-1) TaxID=717774 RepID=F2K1F7_MARM1|nr:hypothetical protein [Marinomonas mediterranea]ADZ91088.1 hypothetical protein Marme_1832 [Marinomonas mediterranea MMB-1]WCN13150.1 hypothetical protein GV054_09095 [Marinomonas mediterranea]WCN17221.1 hypothetical protein GV053_09255 [Marinomonas mediterranea MMB-1]